MKIVRTNRLATIGGLLASFGMGLIGVPTTVLITYAEIVKDGPPHWFHLTILPVVILGVLLVMAGNVITAYVAKGADEHSSIQQVEAATAQKVAVAATKKADEAPVEPTEVAIVNPAALASPEAAEAELRRSAAEIQRLRSLLKL